MPPSRPVEAWRGQLSQGGFRRDGTAWKQDSIPHRTQVAGAWAAQTSCRNGTGNTGPAPFKPFVGSAWSHGVRVSVGRPHGPWETGQGRLSSLPVNKHKPRAQAETTLVV